VKAAPFQYARPASIAEACAALAERGAEAKLIAGGQSLVPMMAMRLARPGWLIDIGRIPELQRIEIGPDFVSIGAGVKQRTVERDAALRQRLPLLMQALAWVGHPQTRNRGTVGGSIVHADPAAEIPLVACVLDAVLELRDAAGTTDMPAREFFLAPMVTAITPEQCLVAVRFPVWDGPRVGSAFEEVSIRHGDFALASACAQIALDDGGRVRRAALGIGGAAPVPQALPEVAKLLLGHTPNQALLDKVARVAGEAIEPEGDLHAPAEYRRELARVLTRRTLEAALK
jgi:CO/xanthine dehydrogenase FAD-binding subunit